MTIAIVIGTRPQYIKIKPLYDHLKASGIDFVLIDTDQHYSPKLSSVFIEQLELKIDYALGSAHNDEMTFFSDCLLRLSNLFDEIKPTSVLVVGDTNSSLIGALLANKKGIYCAHVEAGVRAYDRSRPEEINRILIDVLSDVHFISRRSDKDNVSNPIYTGDLEYRYLNTLSLAGKIPDVVTYDGPLLMTIHRQENVTVERLTEIFDFCKRLNETTMFLAHHRTRKFMQDHNIIHPPNVLLCEPVDYFSMLMLLLSCKGVITDSGGLSKICPFFGKKCLIPAKVAEWEEVIFDGYGRLGEDLFWFDKPEMKRDKSMYYNQQACSEIAAHLHIHAIKG